MAMAKHTRKTPFGADVGVGIFKLDTVSVSVTEHRAQIVCEMAADQIAMVLSTLIP